MAAVNGGIFDNDFFDYFTTNGWLEFVNEAFDDEQYTILQNEEDKLKYFVRRVLSGNQEISRLIRTFWSLDESVDALNYANVKYYVDSFIERFKFYQIDVGNDNQLVLLSPNIALIDNVQSNELRRHFEVNYQRRDFDLSPEAVLRDQEDQENVLTMRNLFQQIIHFFQNGATFEELINWTVRRDYELNEQIMMRQPVIARNAVSMQSLLNYAGIADCDFIKAQIIAYMIMAIVHNVELSGLMIQNWTFYVVKIAQTMQYQKRHQPRAMHYEIDFFLLNDMQELHPREIAFINSLGVQDLNQQNYVFLRQSLYVIRPTYAILMNTLRSNEDFNSLQPGGSISGNQQAMQLRNQLQGQARGMEQQLQGNAAVNLGAALYGNVIDIIARSIVMKLRETNTRLVQYNDQFIRMRLIVSIVIQIPYINSEDVPDFNTGVGQNTREIFQDRYDKYLNQIARQPDYARNIITSQQFKYNVGLSSHYTISFMYERVNSLQEFNNHINNPIAIDAIKANISEKIIQNISDIIFHYESGQNTDQQIFDMVTIAYNLQNALVRQVYIRPVIIYQQGVNARYYVSGYKQQLSEKKVHKIVPVYRTFQNNLRNVAPSVVLPQQIPPVVAPQEGQEEEIPLQIPEIPRQQMQPRFNIPQMQFDDDEEEEEKNFNLEPPIAGLSRSQQLLRQRTEQRNIERQQAIVQQIRNADEVVRQIQEKAIKERSKRKRKAVINKRDYNAEKLLNDFDFAFIERDCMARAHAIICQIGIEPRDFIDEPIMNDELIRMSRERGLKYFTVDYGKKTLFESLQTACTLSNEYIILYMNDHHVFWGSSIRLHKLVESGYDVKFMCNFIRSNIKYYEEQEDNDDLKWLVKIKENKDNQNAKRKSDDLRLFPLNSLYGSLTKHIKFNKKISRELYYVNRVKANVFFDFETTCNEEAALLDNKFVQTEFAVSIVYDIKMKLSRVVRELCSRYNFTDYVDYSLLDYVCTDRQNHFQLGCAAYLFSQLGKKLSHVNNVLNEYNRFCLHLMRVRPKSLKLIEKMAVSNYINCFSYNGAKFDNHFVLSHVKNLYGDSWIDHVTVTGNMNDMKIMSVDQFVFYDLKLMTGGQSLKSFCTDMNIGDQSKKDIDMSKMKTWAIAQDNKDEIMEYVLYDSIAIYEIHKKFSKAIRGIIVDYCMSDEVCAQKLNGLNPMKLSKGIYARWTTISSLSKRIFFDFFNTHIIQSSSNKDVYEFCKDSYQGGYTQAFLLGNYQGPVYYLDYNSMYPAIMSSTNFPQYLSTAQWGAVRYHNVNRENVFQILKIPYQIDTLQVNEVTGMYMLQGNDYNLYEIKSFRFAIDTYAPCFGIRTKLHGTLYPLEYDSEKDESLVPLVVFGFQLRMAFHYGWLLTVDICSSLELDSKKAPIFKKFDDYMYKARQNYKDQKNASMSMCVKVFINSLYGKFGEKIHPLRILMNKEVYEEEEKFQSIIMNAVQNLRDYKHAENIFENIDIKMKRLYDLQERDSGLMEVVIDKIPRKNNHIGSFVYYASLITAIGRMQIMRLINLLQKGDVKNKVFYADTDSIIINEEAFLHMQMFFPEYLDVSQLGKLKNEYPIGNDQSKTAINNLIVFNKKVYQFENEVKNNKIIKFKGCRDPDDKLVDAFMQGDGVYAQSQCRFIKRNGNVTIVDLPMQYVLRLSRKVIDVGLNVITMPFINIREHHELYDHYKKYLKYDEQNGGWTIVEKIQQI